MEPLAHAIISLIFLLAFFPKTKLRYVLALLPIVWIVDLDTFVGVHRFTFHNIFFVLFIAIVVFIAWNKKAFFVALFYGLSHLILDLSEPGAALFYPLYQKTIYFLTTISINPNIFHFSIETLTIPEYQIFLQSLEHPQYFGTTSLILLILTTVLMLCKHRNYIFKK